jgi:hypothetical protein
MHEVKRNAYHISVGKLQQMRPLGEADVVARIIVNCILRDRIGPQTQLRG